MKSGREREEKSKGFSVNPYSTWLHPGTTEFESVKEWILTSMGYPLITCEIDDSQLCTAISNAMRVFTRYYYNPAKYLILDLFFYEPGKGLNLSEYNVQTVRDIGFQRDNFMGAGMDMFFSPYAYFGQGAGFGPLFGMGNGNSVGTWTTWHNANEFMDLCKRMTGSNPDWLLDRVTHYLKIMPEPKCAGKTHRYCCAEVYVEPPLEQILGEDTFLRLALAESKMIVGMVRKKFNGIQLLGGGQIDTEIFNEGKEERDKIIEELQKTDGIGQSFYLS